MTPSTRSGAGCPLRISRSRNHTRRPAIGSAISVQQQPEDQYGGHSHSQWSGRADVSAPRLRVCGPVGHRRTTPGSYRQVTSRWSGQWPYVSAAGPPGPPSRRVSAAAARRTSSARASGGAVGGEGDRQRRPRGARLWSSDGCGHAGEPGRDLALLGGVAAPPGLGQHRPQRAAGCAGRCRAGRRTPGGRGRARGPGPPAAPRGSRGRSRSGGPGRRTPTSVTSGGRPGARSSTT